MQLNKISVINFKNYEEAELDLLPKINCFIGNNGAGKTNLLDAVFYLSFTKSYFNIIDSQNISHGKDFFVIQGTYTRKEKEEKIYCGVKKSKKKTFKRNNKEYNRLADHIGLFPLVMISPADIKLIVEGSDERRKYINFVISQYDKEYLIDNINYNKALKQRNHLLKSFFKKNYFDRDSLDIWTDQLIDLGTKIYKKRREFIKDLVPVFEKYYKLISGDAETINLTYKSQLHDKNFKELFKESLEKDKILQYTTSGVHKDDLLFSIGNHLIKKTGSQGQKKTFLLALKFAQFEFIKNQNGFNPVLLLDDIFDKLDNDRIAKVIKLVSDNNFGQIFITETDKARVESLMEQINIDYKIFNIENGSIK